ncbi:MAG: nudt1 [Candidatus Saccharibacteria bacterium]|nr:nudt1 [Candidatus Saccharibacteria bacterium]
MTKNKKTLTLLFLRQDEQILLAMKKRGFGEGKWNGVGGKVDGVESIEAAMIRETQEEIGVTPTIYEKVGDIRFDEYFKGESTIMHVHVFVASSWDGEPAESEEMKPQWFSIEAIPYDQMWSDDIFWLPAVIEGSKISADFVLDQTDTITDHAVETVDQLPTTL